MNLKEQNWCWRCQLHKYILERHNTSDIYNWI